MRTLAFRLAFPGVPSLPFQGGYLLIQLRFDATTQRTLVVPMGDFVVVAPVGKTDLPPIIRTTNLRHRNNHYIRLWHGENSHPILNSR
jgi:hypothetical protein